MGFITAALVAALIGSTSVLAGETPLTQNHQFSALEGVQTTPASEEELQVAGEGAAQKLIPYVKDSFRVFGATACQLYNAKTGGCSAPNYQTPVFKAVNAVGQWAAKKW
jgi:hypothetical protein